MYKYDNVWFTILWGLLDAGGLQYRTIYTTQQYWLSLWCLWSLWWLCPCDGFIFVVMALSLFRLFHQTMWHLTVGLSLVYSFFVWLTLWIWWHYCYRFVMVRIVKLLLHWCFICLENSTCNIILWWTPSYFSGGGSIVEIFGRGGGGSTVFVAVQSHYSVSLVAVCDCCIEW